MMGMISVKIVTEILTAPYRGKYRSNSFGPIYDPLAFDVFYPDEYSHEFCNLTDTIIQFFQKASVTGNRGKRLMTWQTEVNIKSLHMY